MFQRLWQMKNYLSGNLYNTIVNVVFYFSGTANCLKVAKTIANELGNTEIISMAK
jgi:hypothetical protein